MEIRILIMRKGVYMEEEKKEMYTDNKIKVTYSNMLWLIYRALAEDIITAEELGKIVYKIM